METVRCMERQRGFDDAQRRSAEFDLGNALGTDFQAGFFPVESYEIRKVKWSGRRDLNLKPYIILCGILW